MFKDGFDITVGFLTKKDSVIVISEVYGDGLKIKITNHEIKEAVSIELDHEDVLKLSEILQSAEKYIKENK